MELIQNNSTEILILLFLSITYLLSGYEKVTHWKENVSFIKEHFKISPLKNQVPLLLSIILILEFVGGGMMFVGIFDLATTGIKTTALLGAQLTCVCLIFMLIGQRLAKDYAGAMQMTVYFILNIFAVYLLNK